MAGWKRGLGGTNEPNVRRSQQLKSRAVIGGRLRGGCRPFLGFIHPSAWTRRKRSAYALTRPRQGPKIAISLVLSHLGCRGEQTQRTDHWGEGGLPVQSQLIPSPRFTVNPPSDELIEVSQRPTGRMKPKVVRSDGITRIAYAVRLLRCGCANIDRILWVIHATGMYSLVPIPVRPFYKSRIILSQNKPRENVSPETSLGVVRLKAHAHCESLVLSTSGFELPDRSVLLFGLLLEALPHTPQHFRPHRAGRDLNGLSA